MKSILVDELFLPTFVISDRAHVDCGREFRVVRIEQKSAFVEWKHTDINSYIWLTDSAELYVLVERLRFAGNLTHEAKRPPQLFAN